MITIRVFMLLISSFFSATLFAQFNAHDSIRVYRSISEGLKEPDKVRVLEVSNLTDLDSLNLLTTFENLESLSLIDYHFGTAPPVIAELKGLKELKFINDDFYFIPETYKNLIHLEHLEFINDIHLDLTSTFNFAAALPSLIELRIEGLKGPTIPDQFEFPAQLKILSLRNNHLNNLPAGIGKLSALEVLDIGSNELLELPSFITNLNFLRTIYLDHQPYLRLSYSFELLNQIPTLNAVHLEGNNLNSASIERYQCEAFFKIFLDEDHAILSKMYSPHIQLNLPPILLTPSDKITIISINN